MLTLAVEFLEGPVAAEIAARRVLVEDWGRDGIEQYLHEFFGRPQRRFRRLALGDVLKRAGEVGFIAMLHPADAA